MMTLLLLVALASSPSLEDGRLAGWWKDSERETVSELTRGTDGRWYGVIVASPRKSELGKKSFDGLRWDGESKRFIGKLIKPDDGEVVNVQVWLTSPDSMSAEARVFIFRKSLVFARVKHDRK